MSRPVVVALLVLLAVLAVPTAAQACRCTNPAPGPAAASRADVVAVGRVAELVYGNPRWTKRPTAVVFEVDELHQGATPARVTIALGTTSCALTGWREGETWVVFANRDDDGVLATRQCTGTTRLAKPGGTISPAVLRQLERIGPGRTP